MKKRLLAIALLAVCAASPARAQGLGILGGWGYGSVPNTNSTGNGSLSSNNGFAIGLSAQSGGPLGFGIDGLYAQRGFSSTIAGDGRKLSYIDVPVYLRLSIPNPVVVPFAMIGPQASFELNCDAGGGACPSGDNKITFDGMFAAGVKFPMIAHLSVQGRYIYGLQNLNYSTVSNQSNYHDRSFMLLIGLGF